MLLLAILAVAAWFRFSHLDLTRLNFDRAYPIYQARTILRGVLPWSSLNTSMEFPNPPGWSYALALLAWLPDPVTAALALSSALSLLAVLLVYDLGRRLLGAPAGFVAAGALAINPWAQYYGRGPWVQGPLACGAILVAWLLWPVLLGRTGRPGLRLGLALAVLGLVTQTYLVAYALVLQVALVLIAFRRRAVPASAGRPRLTPLPAPAGRSPAPAQTAPDRPAAIAAGIGRGLLIGCAVLVLLNVPFAHGLWQARDAALRDLQNLAQGQPRFKTRAVEHTFRLVTGQDYELTWTADAPGYPARRLASQVAAGALTLGLLAGCAYAARDLWRPRDPARRDFARLAVLWLLVPLALFTYTGRQVHAFYLVLAYPASLLLLGLGLAPLLMRRAGRIVVAVALAACGAVFAINVEAHYTYDGQNPVIAHIDEMPWRDARAVGERLRAALDGTDPDVRTPADDAWLGAITGLDIRGDRRLDVDGWWTLSVTRPSLYLLQSAAAEGPPAGPPAAATRRDILPLANGYVAFITVDAVPPPAGPASDSGWRAGGIAAEADGDVLRVQSTWSVESLQAEGAEWYFGPFYHLVDGAGDEVLAFGGHGAGAKTWRIGDVYIDVTEIELPAGLPPGTYRLEYGLWDPNRNVRARFAVAGQGRDVLAIPLTLEE